MKMCSVNRWQRTVAENAPAIVAIEWTSELNEYNFKEWSLRATARGRL